MPTCLAIRATATANDPLSQSIPDGRHRSTIFYEDLVRPICEELGLTFLQADGLTGAGLPMDQLLRLVAEADIVVAELGGSDGELSFGLGMRHARGQCTVHITDGSASLPRTAGIPAIELPSRPVGVVMARQQLTAVLADALSGVAAASSPFDPVVQPCEDLAAKHDEDALGFFDLVVDAEAQLEAVSGDMADVESALLDLGAMMELIGEDMVRVNHPGASTSAKLVVVNRLAKAIEGPAGDLEAAAERFAERMAAGVGAFGAFLEWVGNTPRDEWPDNVVEILDDVAAVSLEVRTAALEFQEVMAVIDMFGAFSRQLRGPARRIGASLQAMFRSVAVFEEWQGVAMALKQA
ncbi:hypothetical protein ACIBL5_13010 [Streptomyces sp. NPDC050516]|uniref:hypothetical protein n=1 Tax=Streptomyces sp. NPDC050516 TaxID=3365621 RepID=UPI0037A78CF8